jgi:hypothetical protein
MYCIRRTTPIFDEVQHRDLIEYYKYDGWDAYNPYGQALDLTGVVLFTEGERKANTLRPNEEWQWYGAYKR